MHPSSRDRTLGGLMVVAGLLFQGLWLRRAAALVSVAFMIVYAVWLGRTWESPRPILSKAANGIALVNRLSAPITGARRRPLDRYSILGIHCDVVCDVCARCLGAAPMPPARRASRAVLCVGWGRGQRRRPFAAYGDAGWLLSRSMDRTALLDRRGRPVASTLHHARDSLRRTFATSS